MTPTPSPSKAASVSQGVEQFRKKPVVIEAVQWDGDQKTFDAIERWAGRPVNDTDGYTLLIPTLEGEMQASLNDWIIKGVKGEIYPCKPDIFAATYEAASPEALSLSAAVPASGGVEAEAVKPLEWSEPARSNNGLWTAASIFGTFEVGFDDGWHACIDEGIRWEWEPENDSRSYEGPFAAQAACQDYLEARIRSALLPREAPAAVALTREDQRLLDRALMASTGHLYDLASPAPAPEAPAGWQDISTAPKDGPPILLGLVYRGAIEITEVHIGGYRWAYNEDEESCWWSDQVDDEVKPSFWMSLPALAAQVGGKKATV